MTATGRRLATLAAITLAALVLYPITTAPGFHAAIDATVLICRNFSPVLLVLGVAAVVARGVR